MTPLPDVSVTDRVLKKIETEKLHPRPRWEFIAQDALFWGLGGLSVIFGSFAFSAGMYDVENTGWRFAPVTHDSYLAFFLATAPFLWMIALALFTLIGYENIRRTKRGYRYPLVLIVLGAILASMALGGVIYAAGFGKEIEEALGDHPPFYRPVFMQERAAWLAPERGLLGGEVVSVAPSGDTFVLRDFSGTTWIIDSREIGGRDFATLAQGGFIRVVGTSTTGDLLTSADASASTSLFHACFIFPWLVHENARGGTSRRMMVTFYATTSERNTERMRTDTCRGIRPYERLRVIDEEGF